MSLGTFDPNQVQPNPDNLSDEVVERFLEIAEGLASQGELQLGAEQIDSWSVYITSPSWSKVAPNLASNQLEALIRLFTLGEDQYAPWQAGSQSAVIPLFRALRQRQDFDPALTEWIKAHTRNRFLPYGDLMDRLS